MLTQDLPQIRILALDVEFYTAPAVIQFKAHRFEVGDEIRTTAGAHLSKVGTVRAIHDGWLIVAISEAEQVSAHLLCDITYLVEQCADQCVLQGCTAHHLSENQQNP